jgi:nucleoside-diphosphate-sugar epimerase
LHKSSPRVWVTGGAGFIGSHMVDRLVKDGCYVRVIDNLSTGKLNNNQGHIENKHINLIDGDIQDALVVKKSVDNIATFIHFKVIPSVPFSIANPDLTFDVNVNGTFNLIKAFRQSLNSHNYGD